MRRWVVGFELHHQLLLSVHQTAFTARLQRMTVDKGRTLLGMPQSLASTRIEASRRPVAATGLKSHPAGPLMAMLVKALRDGYR